MASAECDAGGGSSVLRVVYTEQCGLSTYGLPWMEDAFFGESVDVSVFSDGCFSFTRRHPENGSNVKSVALS